MFLVKFLSMFLGIGICLRSVPLNAATNFLPEVCENQ